MLGILKKTKNVISSKHISDHWKERVIPHYARKLMANSLMVFLFILIAIGPIMLFNFIGSTIFHVHLLEFLVSFPGLIVSTSFAAGYFMVRKVLKSGAI